MEGPILNALTVYELNQRLSDVVACAPGVRNVRVVGETSDVRVSGGHCYLELVEKDERGANKSRIRAIIWSSTWRALNDRFMLITGSPITSGIKILATVSASYHPTYGMSVTVSDIDPSFTAGDAVRRRNEILHRLDAEGIINHNRQLAWAVAPMRVAIISAKGAAGFGDFVNHLYTNPDCLRFEVNLFPAVMQGEQTVSTVLTALEKIKACAESFDTVVIIRGGGSTSDLAAFDNYDLARAVAIFPIPVMVGIGHERDVTVLDYVANQRVKTPTAAAEWLVTRARRLLEALGRAADKIYQAAVMQISANRELLARAGASLPGLSATTLLRERARIDRRAADVVTAGTRTVERAAERLDRIEALTRVLSPEAVLKRGFSMTLLPDGRVLRRATDAPAGTVVTTCLESGEITSKTL